tara:strand:- start:111 stop:449 length:339 start_codon:yes stop_codon:yes gene_type:complete
MRFIASFEPSAELSRLCFEVGTQWYILDTAGFTRRWLLKPEVRHGDVEFDVPKLAFVGAREDVSEVRFFFEQYASGFLEHFVSLRPLSSAAWQVQGGQHLGAYLPSRGASSV